MQEDAASMNVYSYVDIQSAKTQPYTTVEA
jgi:hypothetical protein